MLVEELLLKALEDLLDSDVGNLHWHLQLKVLDGCEPIAKARLQGLSRRETVSIMIEHYGEESAVAITVEILEKMRFKTTASKLRNAYAAEVGKTAAATPSSSSSSSAAVAQPAAGPMSADHESTILAPTIGSIIGPVNIIHNSK